MFTKSIKTALVTAAVLVVTTGASMAAQYAWVDQYSKVKKHAGAGPTVNEVYDGQKVKILAKNGSWYKIQIPGQDGWVKKHVLDFNYGPFPGPFPGYGSGYGGGSFCINGESASFCLSGGY